MSGHDHTKYPANDASTSSHPHHPPIKDEYDSATANGGVETDSSTSNSTSSAGAADGSGAGTHEPIAAPMRLQRMQQRKENLFRLPRHLKLPRLAAYSACQAGCGCIYWKSSTPEEHRSKDMDVSPGPPSDAECRTCKHSLCKCHHLGAVCDQHRLINLIPTQTTTCRT